MIKESIIDAVNLLIKEGYLLDNTVGVLLTGKLNRFFLEEMKLENKVVEPEPIIIQRPIAKITLREFKEKAEIPFQIKLKTGEKFTVSAISEKAEKYFNKNISGKVDMETLIKATKAYYADEKNFRQTLTNYIIQDVWCEVLKTYQHKPAIQIANPSFTGERKI